MTAPMSRSPGCGRSGEARLEGSVGGCGAPGPAVAAREAAGGQGRHQRVGMGVERQVRRFDLVQLGIGGMGVDQRGRHLRQIEGGVTVGQDLAEADADGEDTSASAISARTAADLPSPASPA